jgi:hypothetical protein
MTTRGERDSQGSDAVLVATVGLHTIRDQSWSETPQVDAPGHTEQKRPHPALQAWFDSDSTT